MYVLMHNRKQRFERVTRELKVTRVLSTLVEEMKAIGIATAGGGDAQSQCTDVMAPVAHSERSPVLLLMGGEMARGGARCSRRSSRRRSGPNAEGNAVVVEEADAFKETDVIYRAINSMGHHNDVDMLQTAELVVTYTPCTTALHALFSRRRRRRRRQLALLHSTSTTCIVSFLN
jgi:hypothetical protein